ncbi:MAG TPA: hypothetical protein VHM89_10925 [Acidimicrobiales bacterium]|nr:hypothetical protein [Acidimicrobiales bacterium]
MRRHTSFPKAGDRIRLAIPQATDASEPQARYGTVIERSCGRSNALRVRWDRAPGAPLASDAGAETWLADAGWYWDKAHLEVVDDRRAGATPTPVAADHRAPGEVDAWLSASPRATTPTGGVDGSLDAVAEWEAALASEMGGGAGADASWEQLLANALDNGVPTATPRRAAPAPQAPARRPAAAPTPSEEPRASWPAPPVEHHASVDEPEVSWPGPVDHDDTVSDQPAPAPAPVPAPVAGPVQAWKGDDILPSSRSGGRRWGRR